VVSTAVTFRPGTATDASAVVTMPAIVPPTDGCFAPTSITGPGWHAAVRTADASNIQLKRIHRTSTRQPVQATGPANQNPRTSEPQNSEQERRTPNAERGPWFS